MIVIHMVQDGTGNELSREELTIAARNESEFKAWRDDVRDGFARKGEGNREERYWAITAQIPELTHYWWSASPYDAS